MLGYIEGVTCPACEDNMLKPESVHNSYSRYANHYICSGCGIKEALAKKFFWIDNCLAHGIRLNKVGQAVQQSRLSEKED